MNTYHHQLVVEAFRENDDHLSEGQLAAVGGRWWRRVVHGMRKAGYVLIEEASGDWYLEGVPELDVARASDTSDDGRILPCTVAASHPVSGSPDVESEPLFETEPERPSPYDVEAA